MSFRIHWQAEERRGVFPLRGATTVLIWADGALDRVSRPIGAAESGLSVRVEEGGRLELSAHGELRFRSGEQEFVKALLPAGRSVEFLAGAARGMLTSEVEPDLTDPLVGRELGGYRVLGVLGSGAVGTVYRALQLKLDREVALKVLRDNAGQDAEKVASFSKEAVAAGRLSHPHLVQVYDVGESGGRHYYSMELVSGGTLEDRLRREGPLPWTAALAAVREAALALAFAETHQLVHRDVKPENLMVTASGHVKLADLGLAATREMMDQEAAGGTPHFMAPEAIGKKGVDQRADLYSLGCTLFRLLTGKTPFQGDSVREILRAHRDQPAPSLRQAGVTVPKAVEDLLASLLQKDPDKRPAHAKDVAAACEELLKSGAPRRLVVPLVGLLLAAAAVAIWRLGSAPAGGGQDPEVVEVLRDDPDKALREAQLAAERVRSAFFEAKAIDDLEARIRALEGFRAAHPQSELAERAQEEIAAARAALARAAQESAGAAAPDGSDPLEALRSIVEMQLKAGHYGAALAALQSVTGIAPQAVEELQGEVLARGAAQAAALEQEHQAALEARDWAAARATRERYQAALLQSLAAESAPAPWRDQAQKLADLAAAAESNASSAAFLQTRLDFAAALRGAVGEAIGGFAWTAAERRFQECVAAAGHAGLAAAAGRDQELFEAAAQAEALLRARLESGGAVAFTEPLEGKRAELLELAPAGPRLQVQVRGERIERSDEWPVYLRSEVLPGWLREVLPAEAAASSHAVLLLCAHADVARRTAALAGGPPAAVQAQELAAAIRSWLEALPAEAPAAWAERYQAPLVELADACDALAGGDAYSAWLRLERLQGRYSLLGAWISDGSSAWGFAP